MNPSSSPSATLWLELENEAQRRVFELKDNDIVTLGAGKYASFRVSEGSAVGAHFEARGPLIEMVRGYSNKLTLNGAEVEGRALLVGKGSVECDGARVVVSVHLSRPAHADEFAGAHNSGGQEENSSVFHARTEALPRADVPYFEQETVAVHLEQEDLEPTQQYSRVPLESPAQSSGGVFKEPEGMETAVIGTVPDFAQEYPACDEESAYEHTEGIPFGDFAPPTPSSSAIPAFLSPLDENRPKMGRRMRLVRHNDGRVSSPQTPSPAAKVRATDDRTRGQKTPTRVESLRRLLMSSSERVGRLAQQRPLFTYGGVAVGAFCVSMMLLGMGSLLGREPSTTGSAAQEREEQQKKKQPPASPAESEKLDPPVQQLLAPKLQEPEAAEAQKTTPARVSPRTEAKGEDVDPDQEKVARAREFDEAVKHLLAGRYDRAESSYAALSKKFPDETAVNVLYELLKRRNDSSKGNSHNNSLPVILP